MIADVPVSRFRAAIERKLGLSFEDDKRDFLAEVLQTRLDKTGEQIEGYLSRLESLTPHSEWSALGELLTIPETYFFRHYDQFRAFAEVALPDLMRARIISPRLSILSAGCATGEEAYSLAAMAREVAGNGMWDMSVVGVDINPANIRKAIEARYSARALRQTTAEMQQKLFGQHQDYAIDAPLRAGVRFEERNLADEDPKFWRPGSFDIIFCRNVIMYFSPEQAQALVRRFTQALAPGGYLFLGHAENLRGLSQDFHVCHTHETFYYRLRSPGEIAPERRLSTPEATPLSKPLAEVVDENLSWFEAIRTSSERVQSLADAPASAPTNTFAQNKPRWNLTQAFDLLRHERFDEALKVVRSLPAEAANDVDAVLLKAVLCAHSGKLDEAEQVCRHLLDLDELNAGAQYVLAICCEGAGDNPAAVSHDQTAVYLDPTFAMPRLHLGLLARRANDLQTARRELQQALILLQREELSRLLLFGGGFGREALLALCHAELASCGGTP